ncbi:hypothetical protein Tco_1364415 [Tanacetum coccineum]
MLIQQQADMGEGSGQPIDPQHTSTSTQPSNEEPIIVPSSSQPKKTFKRRKTKKVTEIPQSSKPTTLVTDEAVHEERGDSVERAATTATSLDAKQDNGGRPKRQETMGDRPTQTRRSSLGEEDASKQGRNLKQGKQRSTFKESDVDEDLDNAVMDEAIEHVYEADKDVEGDAKQVSAVAVDVSTSDAVNTACIEVNTASAPVTTAGISVTTVEPSTPPLTTTTIFEDEDLTIA